MSHCVIYNSPKTGRAIVVYPAYSDLSSPAGDTDADLILRMVERGLPAGVNYTVVDSSDIPTDRSQRQAWVVIDGTIELDPELIRVVDED